MCRAKLDVRTRYLAPRYLVQVPVQIRGTRYLLSATGYQETSEKKKVGCTRYIGTFPTVQAATSVANERRLQVSSCGDITILIAIV